MPKLEAEPRLAGESSRVVEWARRVTTALNPLVDYFDYLVPAQSGAAAQLTIKAANGANPAAANLNLIKTGTASCTVTAYQAASGSPIPRWQIELGNGIAESGANAGSNFSINRYSDAGAYVDSPISIVRSTGLLALGVIGSSVNSTIGFICRAGSGGAAGNIFNFFWTGAALQAWVDSTYLGNVTITSDERVKHSVESLEFDRDAFMAMRPIRYRFRDRGIFRDDGADKWGFSAQNLSPLIRPAVIGDVDAVDEAGEPITATLDTTPILAVTVLEVQALIREVAALRAEIEILKGAQNGGN